MMMMMMKLNVLQEVEKCHKPEEEKKNNKN